MPQALIGALIAMTVALLATSAKAAVPDRPANIEAARMKNGESAVGGGVIPDLRASAFLNNDFWYEIVLNGAMKDNGMASFKSVLDHQSAEVIRAYVIHCANEDSSRN
jgi:hypothetical protein